MFDWLRRKREVVVLDVAAYGERLTWPAVQAALHHQIGSAWYRALGQILEHQRQRCQNAVADKSNLPNGQTAFEAGGAAALADVMDILAEIERGTCQDERLKQWFDGGVQRE